MPGTASSRILGGKPEPIQRPAEPGRERELGKLSGDISIERENFKFYFPVVTCIVISLLLTGIIWLVRFFSK